MLKKFLHAFCVGISSSIKVLHIKLRYGNKVSMGAINSLKGRFSVQVANNGRIRIGKFIMCTGPTYLKTEEDAEILIGDRVFLNHNFSATAMKKIVIGNNCNIANNVVIVDHDHAILNGSPSGIEFVVAPVVIGDRVWIGANSTILKGVNIGDDAVIAAGAVVTHDVGKGTLVAGVPARFIRRI